MIFNFNYNTVQEFTVVLAHRNLKLIDTLTGVSSLNYKKNLNAADELSFTLNKVDITDELWNEVYDLRLVYVPEIKEYFQIEVATTESATPVKQITGTSLCEAELSQINLYTVEINTEDDIARDDYDANMPTVLYRDPEDYAEDWYQEHVWVNDEGELVRKYVSYNDDGSINWTETVALRKKAIKKASLMHRVLDKAPNYEVDHVDDSVKNLQRSFSADGTSIYDFLTGDAAEQFNCLFQFDSSHRTISIYDLYDVCQNDECSYYLEKGKRYRGDFIDYCPKCGSSNVYQFGEDLGVYVDVGNLTDEMSLSVESGSIKNTFKLEAGDEDMTAAVINCNPNGSAYIYHFSDEQKHDMSDELVAKLESYDALYESYQDQYSKLAEILYDAYDDELYYQSSMMPSENTGTITVETELATLTEEITSGNLSTIAMNSLSADTALYKVENAIKNYAKLFIHTSYVKFEFDESDFTYKGTDSDGNLYGIWTGTIKLTSYSNSDDYDTTDVLSITINNNYEDYTREKLIKKLGEDASDGYIYQVIDKSGETTLEEYTAAIKLYSVARLESFNAAIGAVLNILDEIEDENVKEEFQTDYSAKQKATIVELSKRETQVLIAQEIQDQVQNTGEFSIVTSQPENEIEQTYTIWSVGDLLDVTKAVACYCTKDSDGNYTTDYDVKCTCGKHTIVDENGTVAYSDNKIPAGTTFQSLYVKILKNTSSTWKLIFKPSQDFETMSDINNVLDFDDYLGDDLYSEFATFRREDTYKNDNFISDGKTDNNSELIEYAQEFLQYAKEDIVEASEYQYNLSTDLKNAEFFNADDVVIGEWFRFGINNFTDVHMGEEGHTKTHVVKMRLISYTVDFDNISTLAAEFANLTKTATSMTDVQEILDQANSMATSYSAVSKQALSGQKASEDITTIQQSGLNSALININSNTNDEIVIDNLGLTARTYDDIEDAYSGEQFRLTHNIMCYTDDNWATVKAALGKHNYTTKVLDVSTGTVNDDNGTAYGLSADFVQAGKVIGSDIYGSKMVAGKIASTNYNASSSTGTYIDLDNGSFSFAGGRIVYNGSDSLKLQNVVMDWTSSTGTDGTSLSSEFQSLYNNAKTQADAAISTFDANLKSVLGDNYTETAASDATAKANSAYSSAVTAAKIETASQVSTAKTELTSAYESYTTSAILTYDQTVAKYLTGGGSTSIGTSYVISPYIGGGYLNITSGNKRVIIDPANLTNNGYIFQIHNDSDIVMGVDSSGNATFSGKITSSAGQIGGWTISDTMIYNDFTDSSGNLRRTRLSTSGTFSIAVVDKNATALAGFTKEGELRARGGGDIGAWTIGSGDTGALYCSKSSLESSTAGVYLGSDGISLGESNTFEVTSTGVLTATSGTIGGWTLGERILYKDSSDSLLRCRLYAPASPTSSNFAIGILGRDSTSDDWSGLGGFYWDGRLLAKKGKIGGWTISDSTLYSDYSDSSSNKTLRTILSSSDTFRFAVVDVTNDNILAGFTQGGRFRAKGGGTIGAWSVQTSDDGGALYSSKSSLTSSTAGVYLGADGISLGSGSVFKVTKAGALTATNATITGAITATSGSFTGKIVATSGTIGGFTISDSCLSGGTSGYVARIYSGTGISVILGSTTYNHCMFVIYANGGATPQVVINHTGVHVA